VGALEVDALARGVGRDEDFELAHERPAIASLSASSGIVPNFGVPLKGPVC
jgi:hypothetical protein